jgi:hypothetical protein
VGETPKSTRFGLRPLKLTLVPATALAVFAFTTPAHAEESGALSVTPATVAVAVPSAPDAPEVTQLALGEVQTTVASAVASIPDEPAGDGSAADPVAAFAAAPMEQSTDVPTNVEGPANQPASSAPAAPDGSIESSSDVSAQPAEENGDRAASVAISGPQPSAAAPTDPATASGTQTAADPVESPPGTQYQSRSAQYQPVQTIDHRLSGERPTGTALAPKRAVRAETPNALRHSSKSVQILSRICADIGGENPALSAGDELLKSEWNITQIGGCILDLSDASDVPAEVVTSPDCESASQYQLQDGQYQPVGCEPAVDEPIDANSTAPSDCVPDLSTTIDQIAPIEIVIGDSSPLDGPAVQDVVSSTGPVTCVVNPVAGTATAPAVASPQVPGVSAGQAETGAAMPRPVSQTVEKPAPSTKSQKHQAQEHVSASAAVDRGGPRRWVVTARPPWSRPQSARPRSHSAREKHQAAPLRTSPETSGPPARFEALQAQPVERSSSSGTTASAESAWLAAAALLFLFALGSFGLAVAGASGRGAVPTRLSLLRARITSKGLSSHPADRTNVDAPRGIRYRD